MVGLRTRVRQMLGVLTLPAAGRRLRSLAEQVQPDPVRMAALGVSLNALREALALTAMTVHRALNAGTALKKGLRAGWSFKYVDLGTGT